MEKILKYVATHNGSFHADDVFAYVVLRKLFPSYELIRSRNPEILKKAEILFDVGGGKYDHHSTDKEYRANGIPYAAFGLIWRDFGQVFLSKWFDSADIDYAYQKIDADLVQNIDAFDNGVDIFENPIVEVETLSTVIAGFNNRVPEVFEDDGSGGYNFEMEWFLRTCDVAESVLINHIYGIRKLLSMKETVLKAFEKRRSPEVLILDAHGAWEEWVRTLDEKKEILFVVHPKNEEYHIQVMRKEKNSFEARKDLPASWAGKRDDALNQVTGIHDAIFCHPARFLAIAKSKESILKMAELALQD